MTCDHPFPYLHEPACAYVDQLHCPSEWSTEIHAFEQKMDLEQITEALGKTPVPTLVPQTNKQTNKCYSD